MIRFVDLVAQYHAHKEELDAAISTVLSSASFIGGKPVAEFESAFAKYLRADHCVGVANGTDALEIAFEALGLPPNSEIIVPANSFIASSEAVTRSGHRVVFADIVKDTYLLDPADVERRLSPRTRAIVAVHLYGQPAPIEELSELARRHGLKVIEDCAQAHGAELHGRRVGTLGDVAAFSFYPGKNLGAYGDAGAIVTNDAKIANRCRMIANHGRVDKYDHEFEGRNSRLDGLQAAVLSVKLRHLEAWIERRQAIAGCYSRELSGLPQVGLPTIRDGTRHVFHLYVVRVRDRSALAQYLAERGIQTGIHYPVALPKLKAYEYLGQGRENMLANQQDRELLSLPIGEHLSESDALQVCAAIKDFYVAQ